MVETKAAKRQGAKKVARRAVHELQTEVKRIEKAAVEKKDGAAAGRARGAATRPRGAANKEVKQENDAEMLGALAQAGGEDDSDSEGESGALGGQRLVVKLDSAQKQRLAKGLKQIAAKPAEAEEAAHSQTFSIT